MFQEIIQATYAPGVNVQGDVPEGNWVFLLPDLDLDQVLMVGEPSPNTLRTLESLANRVHLVSKLTEPGLAGSFDLIYLANSTVDFDWSILKRLLKAKGTVYYEGRGKGRLSVPSSLYMQQRLWLTPSIGRMQTAVPLSDRQTIRYFQTNALYSPTISLQTFDDLRQWWRRGQSKGPKGTERQTGASASGVPKRRKGLKKHLRTFLRKSRNLALRWSQAAEKRLLQVSPAQNLMRRYGVILINSEAGQNESINSLPDYVQRIAHADQIELRAFRWGYAARGRYNSQKLLFFLFRPQEEKPVYVVKMVRDAVFNPRLEREHKGLLRLQEDRIMPVGTLPEIVFAGRHHGLVLVGETVIEGEAFESRTTFTSDCQYAQKAVQWLIELSARTVTPANSQDIVASMQAMVDRFVELYRPTEDQRKFLNEQVETLRQNPPPLVFQHGDPGSWNLLVTPDNEVAFLDWENATLQALPLWDLFYFLRSYCVAAGQKSGDFGNVEAFEQLFVQDSPLSPLIVSAVKRYVQQVELNPLLVKPLFYLCWLFWAMKQAAMTELGRLQTAFYWQSLQMCMAQQNAPTLRRLFSLEEAD